MRTFLVMRYTPDGEKEVLTVEAHAMQLVEAGCVEFIVFTKRESGSMSMRVVRMLNNVEDVMDLDLTHASRPIVH